MKSILSILASLTLSTLYLSTPALAKEDLLRTSNLTEEQRRILEAIPEKEEEYLSYGLQAPLYGDFKNPTTKVPTGSWSWRDGVICVTTEGFGTDSVNTWHSAIVAPQRIEAVIEAKKLGHTADFRYGKWESDKHTIWQVGVLSTSVDQDYNAGHWAGQQQGKPYNLNFWSCYQTDSFYCSQLVWAAYYYTAGVDLNKSDNDFGSSIAVHPGEFVENPNTLITYRNR